VGTPNMYNSQLWKTSGHWENYKEDMFTLKVDDLDFGLKPMNCPGHCLMFKSTSRTYREFPIRYADFGVLHRNEASGALTGLTRVRRFQQDDAHIFVREDQIKDEIMASFDFLSKVYETFGFQFKLVLSTRNPAKFIGAIETWDRAEAALASALDTRIGPGNWDLNPEDGAFYGPKVVSL
jgi:threonyl-tRNA synthetase